MDGFHVRVGEVCGGRVDDVGVRGCWVVRKDGGSEGGIRRIVVATVRFSVFCARHLRSLHTRHWVYYGESSSSRAGTLILMLPMLQDLSVFIECVWILGRDIVEEGITAAGEVAVHEGLAYTIRSLDPTTVATSLHPPSSSCVCSHSECPPHSLSQSVIHPDAVDPLFPFWSAIHIRRN